VKLQILFYLLSVNFSNSSVQYFVANFTHACNLFYVYL